MIHRRLQARSRLETFANISRTESDEVTYGLHEERADIPVGGSGHPDDDGAGRADVDAVEHAARKGRMEMSGLPHRECTNASGGCFVAKACLFNCKLNNDPLRAYRVLKMSVEAMMAPLGYHGQISAKDDRVQAVMDALHQVDEVDR